MIDGYDDVVNIQLGSDLTSGLGAGARPDIGRQAAQQSKDQLADVIASTDLIFIAAGMGGGTGTGAAPVIAQLAREHDVLSVAVVTTPFKHEGKMRAKNASEGIEELSKYTDSLITVDNNKLIDLEQDDITLACAFDEANKVLSNAVKCITEIVTEPGYINVDFADLKMVMSETGMAMIGTGIASGANRAVDAVRAALDSPLINQQDMSQAKGMIINVTGNSKMKLSEYNSVCDQIKKMADSEAHVFSGMVFNEEMGDNMRVSIVAAGLQETPTPVARGGHGDPRGGLRPEPLYGRFASRQSRAVNSKADLSAELVSVPAFLRNQAD
ncbi:MAG: cell division protein FtsZ [Gammaproteobacteria bacterium]|nr:cell division protein FtsZ [Gammaproteobacteria bacterium]